MLMLILGSWNSLLFLFSLTVLNQIFQWNIYVSNISKSWVKNLDVWRFYSWSLRSFKTIFTNYWSFQCEWNKLWHILQSHHIQRQKSFQDSSEKIVFLKKILIGYTFFLQGTNFLILKRKFSPVKREIILFITQQTFTWSNSTIETLATGVKYI